MTHREEKVPLETEGGGSPKKYKTVVIDPPWQLNEGTDIGLQGGRLTSIPYSVMTDDDILTFDIDAFAADRCILFMWATAGKTKRGIPILELAFKILREWGFTYRTMIYWKKPSDNPAIFIPFRRSLEPILFATRGISQVPPYGKYSDIFESQKRKHSEKPARFYQLLRAWTPEPRIDIFARNAHEGFDGWGDEYVGEGPLQEFLT